MDGGHHDISTIGRGTVQGLTQERDQRGEAQIVTTVTFGELKVDIQRALVFIGDKQVHLTGTEFLLLRALMMHSSGVIRRDALLSTVRSHTRHLSSRSLDGHLSRLRSKLGRYGPWIRTFKGVGYRFFPTIPLS